MRDAFQAQSALSRCNATVARPMLGEEDALVPTYLALVH